MTRLQLSLVLVATAILLAMPLVGGNYVLRLATIMLMYATLAMAWNFIGGFAGYPSFGLAAFFGLGAYAGGVVQSTGASIALAWLAAVVVGTLFALVLNLPFFGWSPAALSAFFFYAMLALTAVTFVTTFVVAHNRLGFGLTCIRQNEDAANIVGIDTTRYKIYAFTLSGGFAAAAGGIYASWIGYIEPGDVYDVLFSIKPIVMVLLGGMGTVFGPIFGAVAFLVLDEVVWRNFLELNTGILGLLIVILILYLPAGLASFDVRSLWRKAATP
jgi:branched-chain amino acid transport system permease protein